MRLMHKRQLKKNLIHSFILRLGQSCKYFLIFAAVLLFLPNYFMYVTLSCTSSSYTNVLTPTDCHRPNHRRQQDSQQRGGQSPDILVPGQQPVSGLCMLHKIMT